MLGHLDQLLSPDEGRVDDVYEIGTELGKGAFSVVRQGRHRQTGEHVAIKIIPAARFKANKRAQEAIRAEVEAMRRIRWRLNNPNLIAMLGVFSDPTRVSIVLEQLNGGELFDRIVSRGRYTERDASKLLYKLAEALAQCHQQGILHRDVKPENVLYVSGHDNANIKITDFGLAMLDDGPSVVRRDDNLVGTPGYVAPEVLKHRLYGPPCDVWACGVITYILLVGYPPFYPSGDETLFEVIKKGQYYFHPDAWDLISGEAKDLVYNMLMVDVEKRATMESILQHPWVAQSVSLPEQHLSGTINRLRAFNAKRKWRAVAAVVMMGARLGLKKRSRHGTEEPRGDHGFSEPEMETLKMAFNFSAQGGVLGRAQLASVLRDVGFGPVPSDRLFDLFDVDGNGEVDFGEFVKGVASFKHSGDKALRFCFDIYDREGVGAINMEQLKSVLSCVIRTQDSSSEAQESDGSLDQEDTLSEMFQKLDVDGNGTIDFDEFKAGVKREPMLVRAFLAPVQQGSLASAPAARRLSGSSQTRPEGTDCVAPSVTPHAEQRQRGEVTGGSSSCSVAGETGAGLGGGMCEAADGVGEYCGGSEAASKRVRVGGDGGAG